MSDTNPTETRTASVFKDEHGVIVITMKNCGQVDHFDIMDLNLVIRHKAQGKRCLKLVIAADNWDPDKKAREMIEKEDNLSMTKARAIVVSGSIKASLLNFIKQFDHKDYPQQFFTDRETAYNWLMSFNKHKFDDIAF